MLISFSVRNFRTFRDKVEWSLIASPDKTREEDNVIDVPAFGLRLLKSAVVYGANASGKSKLVDALKYMQWFMATSSKNGQIGEPTGVEPFKLNLLSNQDSSEFEVQFMYQGKLYRYGFEVSYNKVEAEWLFVQSEKKIRKSVEIELFYRNGQDIDFDSKKFGGIAVELVKNSAIRENALFISVASQFNHSIATSVVEGFKKVMIFSGNNEVFESALTMMNMRDDNRKARVLKFMESVDVDMLDIKQSEQPLFDLDWTKYDAGDYAKQMVNWADKEYFNIKTMHNVYDDANMSSGVTLFLLTDESVGTQKLFRLAGPLLSALDAGLVLIVDELDARLHPNLVSKIVQLFNSKETNPNNAQLLFNTHDTNLLTSGNFRRDQIWFTEKNRYGEATLYSLADFKTDVVKKDDNFEANYVRGKYGAVPYLGDFNALPKTSSEAEPKPQPSHE